MNKIFSLVFMFFLSCNWSGAIEIRGKAVKENQDIKGSQDHAMVSRFPESWIVQYEVKEFDQMGIPMGPTKKFKEFQKTETVEGKITRIGYALPVGRSSFEALRQYEGALKKAGFSRVFGCDRENCGSSFPSAFEALPGEHGDFRMHEPERNTLFYSAWKLSDKERNVYVMLVTFAVMEIRRVENSFALIRIAEVKGMEEGLVRVDAAAMQKGIETEGHIALYDILFDFNKAEIKPESDSTLQEIATMLKQNAQWKLYVVGHTDNVGTYNYNIDLSQHRAAAAVNELTKKYGITPGRLQATGVGPTAPVASNDSEEGRAKNRRVELVKQ